MAVTFFIGIRPGLSGTWGCAYSHVDHEGLAHEHRDRHHYIHGVGSGCRQFAGNRLLLHRRGAAHGMGYVAGELFVVNNKGQGFDYFVNSATSLGLNSSRQLASRWQQVRLLGGKANARCIGYGSSPTLLVLGLISSAAMARNSSTVLVLGLTSSAAMARNSNILLGQ